MIVDSSAVIAVLKEEPEAGRFLRELTVSGAPKRMSAANYLEAAIVVDANRNPLLGRRFDDLVARTGIAVEPVDREQAEIARAAYRDFGKGSGHPASLNFGRLFRLCARPRPPRAAPLQGRRLFANRRRRRLTAFIDRRGHSPL